MAVVYEHDQLIWETNEHLDKSLSEFAEMYMNFPTMRDIMPNLVAADIIGAQPMSGPTGEVFVLKTRYSYGRRVGNIVFEDFT